MRTFRCVRVNVSPHKFIRAVRNRFVTAVKLVLQSLVRVMLVCDDPGTSTDFFADRALERLRGNVCNHATPQLTIALNRHEHWGFARSTPMLTGPLVT